MVLTAPFLIGCNVPTYEDRTFGPEIAALGGNAIRQVLTPRADMEARLLHYRSLGLFTLGLWVKESAYSLSWYAERFGPFLDGIQVWNEADSWGKTSAYIPPDVRVAALNAYYQQAQAFLHYNPRILVIGEGIGNGQPSELDGIDGGLLSGVAAHMYWKPPADAGWFPNNFYNKLQRLVYITEIDIKDHPDTVTALARNPVVAGAFVYTAQAWYDPRADVGWPHALYDTAGNPTSYVDVFRSIAREINAMARAPIVVGEGIRNKMNSLGDNPIEPPIWKTNPNGSTIEEVRGFKGRYLATNAHPDEQWRTVYIPYGGA